MYVYKHLFELQEHVENREKSLKPSKSSHLQTRITYLYWIISSGLSCFSEVLKI